MRGLGHGLVRGIVRGIARATLRTALAASAAAAGFACSATPASTSAAPGPSSTAAALAGPSSSAAATTARFDVETANGRVTRIVMQPAGRAERYVFDRFVDDDAALRAETQRRAVRPAFCAASKLDDAQCRRTCGWAEAARPFTRVTLETADGRSQALSADEPTPMRLNAGAGSHGSERGDCLSPDARYLSVFAAADDSGPGAAQAMIVELARGLPAARFVGERSGKTYGEDRYFDFAGWQAGQPHALRFSWGGGDAPVDDIALPR